MSSQKITYIEGKVLWLLGFVNQDDCTEEVRKHQEQGARLSSWHIDNLPKEYGGPVYTAIMLMPDKKEEADGKQKTTT